MDLVSDIFFFHNEMCKHLYPNIFRGLFPSFWVLISNKYFYSSTFSKTSYFVVLLNVLSNLGDTKSQVYSILVEERKLYPVQTRNAIKRLPQDKRSPCCSFRTESWKLFRFSSDLVLSFFPCYHWDKCEHFSSSELSVTATRASETKVIWCFIHCFDQRVFNWLGIECPGTWEDLSVTGLHCIRMV